MQKSISKEYTFVFAKRVDFTSNEGEKIQGIQFFVFDPDDDYDTENSTDGNLSKFWLAGEDGLSRWGLIKGLKKDDTVTVDFSLRGQKVTPIALTKAPK
jgi:hypothetical protein